MGRPSKLDDIVAQRVINAVKSGVPRVQAARLARVVPSTLFLWLAKGKAGDPAYSDFSDKVREAEAYDVEELVGFMRTHAKASWQACAWLLEKRAPKQFAAKKGPAAEAVSGTLATSYEEQVSHVESVLAALKSAGG